MIVLVKVHLLTHGTPPLTMWMVRYCPRKPQNTPKRGNCTLLFRLPSRATENPLNLQPCAPRRIGIFDCGSSASYFVRELPSVDMSSVAIIVRASFTLVDQGYGFNSRYTPSADFYHRETRMTFGPVFFSLLAQRFRARGIAQVART